MATYRGSHARFFKTSGTSTWYPAGSNGATNTQADSVMTASSRFILDRIYKKGSGTQTVTITNHDGTGSFDIDVGPSDCVELGWLMDAGISATSSGGAGEFYLVYTQLN